MDMTYSDRTEQAVTRQLKGMGCPKYDLGIRRASGGMMINRTWTPQIIMKSIPWLKLMNKGEHDIYIRPANEILHGLVLVDDVSFNGLDSMKENGLSPAVVTETSHRNFQAWIKLGADVTADLRTIVARRLAADYDSDPASAEGRHFGRLAGFTNRKPKHMSNGRRFPWVLCRESGGKTAAQGARLIIDAQAELERGAKTVRDPGPVPFEIQRRTDMSGRDVVEEYNAKMQELAGDNPDLSVCDWNVAIHLAIQGWDREDIMRAMTLSSPNIRERKSDVGYYVGLTVGKVMNLPHVRAMRSR
jgi:hypothetical protein